MDSLTSVTRQLYSKGFSAFFSPHDLPLHGFRVLMIRAKLTPRLRRQLTKSLLKRDFGLDIEVPDDRLCPPVHPIPCCILGSSLWPVGTKQVRSLLSQKANDDLITQLAEGSTTSYGSNHSSIPLLPI